MLSRAVSSRWRDFRFFVQSAAHRLHGQQLDVDELVEDFVEFGGVDLQPLVALDHALNMGFQFDIRNVDRLTVNQRRHGRRVGGRSSCDLGGGPPASGQAEGKQCSDSHACQAIPDGHALAPSTA